MTNTNKINKLLVSLVAAVALWVIAVPAALACGSYGPPSDEDQAVWAVWDDFYGADRADDARLAIDEVRVVAGRFAFVTAHVTAGEDTADATFALVKLGNRWTVAAGAEHRPVSAT